MPTQIPFDLTQNGALELRWREHFRWPLPASSLYDIHATHTENFLRFAASLEPDARNVVLLGRAPSLGALVEAAYLVQAEGSEHYLFGPPELAVLRGHQSTDQMSGRGAGHHGKKGGFRHQTLRQIARTLSWSTAKTALPNLLSPDAIALSHNSLMRDYIKQQRASVGFRHGAAYLDDTVSADTGTALAIDTKHLVDQFLHHVISFNDLDEEITRRLRALLRPLLAGAFQQASQTLGALRSCARLPSSIWTGTGAAYPGRALGLEVLERGGEAWRFDHGGTVALSSAFSAFAVNELSVSSHVVLPTAAVAKNDMVERAGEAVSSFRGNTILGHSGDPSLDVGDVAFRPNSRPNTNIQPRRRVLYVSTAFYGFYQTSTPVLPGIPYMEWQMRLLEALKRLPIELASKPHPEGLLRGKGLPTEQLAPALHTPFEEALKNADVLVMDVPASTTFSIALTTDRPIVFFDFGLLPFNKDVAEEIEKRCRILRPTYTAANQPQFDESELAEAVCGGTDDADPTFFRTLYLGN